MSKKSTNCFRVLVFGVTSLLFSSCDRNVKKSYFPDGRIESEKTYEKNKVIHKKVFYTSGVIKWECSYVDEKEDGICKEYSENGKLHTYSELKNGLQNGTFISYYENGHEKKKCLYKEGKINGDFFEYDREGNIKTKAMILNDVAKYKVEYDSHGNVLDEYHDYSIRPSNDTLIISENYELDVEIVGEILKHKKIGLQYQINGLGISKAEVLVFDNTQRVKKIKLGNLPKGEYSVVLYCPTLSNDNSVLEYKKRVIIK